MEKVEINPFLVQKNQMIEAVETFTDSYIVAYNKAFAESKNSEFSHEAAKNMVTAIMQANN
jgi:DNA-binding protein YbaB